MTTAVAVNTRTVIAKRKRKVFLNLLARCGSVIQASQAAGYQDPRALQAYRKDNDDFADDWAAAVDAAACRLEDEADRRGIEGWLEPVFHKGAIVGHIRKFSDAMLALRLKGLKPDTYRDSARGGDVNVSFGIAVIPMAAKSEEEWEKEAIEMHSNQKVIELEAKPTENTMLRVKRTNRGD